MGVILVTSRWDDGLYVQRAIPEAVVYHLPTEKQLRMAMKVEMASMMLCRDAAGEPVTEHGVPDRCTVTCDFGERPAAVRVLGAVQAYFSEKQWPTIVDVRERIDR